MIAIKTKEWFWRFTLKDILTILCSAAIPLALAIYTATNYKQQQEQAEKARLFDQNQTETVRQQAIYDKFLNNIYKLDKNGYLKPGQNVWALPNAYYRAAHRQWDVLRKADVLQFLREKNLIGRENCSAQCEKKGVEDIIRLNELSFDKVHLASETGLENARMKLDCVSFGRVSWMDGNFSYVNLDGTSFDGARLNRTKFHKSTLRCASFIGAQLQNVDFENAELQDAFFAHVDLSTTKLTAKQIEQAFFYNVTFPPGMPGRLKLRPTPTPMTTTTATAIATATTTPCSEVSEETTAKASARKFKRDLGACAESGQLITFDDLATGGAIPNGYHDFNWVNGWYTAKSAYGDRSGNYVLFNKNGRPMILTSSTHGRFFSLKSCIAAAVWNDDLRLEVVGYQSETVVANSTYILRIFTATTLNFHGYSELDKVVWKTFGGHPNLHVDGNGQEFAMDNLCLEFD